MPTIEVQAEAVARQETTEGRQIIACCAVVKKNLQGRFMVLVTSETAWSFAAVSNSDLLPLLQVAYPLKTSLSGYGCFTSDKTSGLSPELPDGKVGSKFARSPRSRAYESNWHNGWQRGQQKFLVRGPAGYIVLFSRVVKDFSELHNALSGYTG